MRMRFFLASPKEGRWMSGGHFQRLVAGGALALLIAGLLTACGQKQEEASAPRAPNQPNRHVVIETDLGTIKFELLENEAPRTAENFRLLAERGYYNGLIFHRVAN